SPVGILQSLANQPPCSARLQLQKVVTRDYSGCRVAGPRRDPRMPIRIAAGIAIKLPTLNQRGYGSIDRLNATAASRSSPTIVEAMRLPTFPAVQTPAKAVAAHIRTATAST